MSIVMALNLRPDWFYRATLCMEQRSKAAVSGAGTVFALNIDGSGFTNLHSFTGSDGDSPLAGLISLGNALYGTAQDGGHSDEGTLYAVNTDGFWFYEPA